MREIKNQPIISPYVYAGLFKADYNLRSERYLLDVVSKHFGVSKEEIIGTSRVRYKVMPRHALCKILREYTPLNLKEIGKFLGGRDHSTIIHAISATNDSLDTDKVFKRKYKELLEKI